MTAQGDNPFTPDGLRWRWSASSSTTAKDCWRKYHYSQLYVSKGENINLAFGKYYAGAIEQYHKLRAAGSDYPEALHLTVKTLLESTAEWRPEPGTGAAAAKTRETLIRSVIWYLESYTDDPCHTVILADATPAVELPFLFQVDSDIWFYGKLDRIVEYAGQQWIQDQKTTGSTLSSYYFKRYNPDNQMSMYALAASVAWKTRVAGVMIDAAQIAVGFTRFERGMTFRTDLQLQEWLDNTRFRLREQEDARDAGWPMNDAACQKYGGCPFLEVCSKDPRVRKEFLETGFDKREQVS